MHIKIEFDTPTRKDIELFISIIALRLPEHRRLLAKVLNDTIYRSILESAYNGDYVARVTKKDKQIYNRVFLKD